MYRLAPENVLPQEIAAVLKSAECLYSGQEINEAINRLAIDLQGELANTNPVFLCVMNGALIITGQLVMRLPFPVQIDSLHISRYRETTQGGTVEWQKAPGIPLEGRTVLVIDDILDEGYTLAAIFDYCRIQGAREVLSAVLVEKIHDRKHPEARADFVGLTVDDRYVFGYGMDYKNYLRNLPEIYALPKS